MTPTPMQMLFSFDGRIRRTQYWLWSIGVTILFVVVATIVLTVTGAAASMRPDAAVAGGGMATIGWLIYGLLIIPMIWISLALEVKRWHDRDKSWFWLFIAFVPIIGGLWILIECGFMDGTQGPNRFGPSPKGIA